MPRVDRILARLGAFEILHTDTPNPAVISEAIELSEEFSTDDSAPFLNGLLGAVITHGPARVEDQPSDDAASLTCPAPDGVVSSRPSQLTMSDPWLAVQTRSLQRWAMWTRLAEMPAILKILLMILS